MSDLYSLPKKTNYILRVCVFLAVSVTILGAVGLTRTLPSEQWSPLTLANKMVGQFLLEPLTSISTPDSAWHWTLNLAQFLSRMLLLLLIVSGLRSLFRERFEIWRFRHISGHDVFIGVGERGHQLALKAAREGIRVVAIDSDEHNEVREALQACNGLFIHGSGLKNSLLHAARVHAARRVVILTADDSLNAHIAEKVSAIWRESHAEALKLGDAPSMEILVSVADPEFRELLRERWESVINNPAPQLLVKLVGFRSVALRSVLLDIAKSAGTDPAIRARGIQVLVAGENNFVEEFLKLAVGFLQISGAQKPRFVVCTTGASLAAAFSTRYPAIDTVATVRFVSQQPVDVAWADDLAGEKFDVAVIAMTKEADTLCVGERVLRSSRFSVASVKALVQGLPAVKITPLQKMQVISMFERGCNSVEFGEMALEQQAKANHEAYLLTLSTTEWTNSRTWEKLPERLKESNRWVVLHHQVKQAIWKTAHLQEHVDLFELLTVSDHCRWVGAKVMHGWKSGNSLDPLHRLDPEICPFDQLPKTRQESIRAQVKKTLAVL